MSELKKNVKKLSDITEKETVIPIYTTPKSDLLPKAEPVITKPDIVLGVSSDDKRKLEAGHLIPEKGDSDEILFLKNIYTIQNEGCYGKHLNQLIKDRITVLKAK